MDLKAWETLFSGLIFLVAAVGTVSFDVKAYGGCSNEDYLQAELLCREAMEEASVEKKIDLFELAFKICPYHGNFGQGYYILGRLYFERKEYDRAFKWLRLADRFKHVFLETSANDFAVTNLLLGKLYRKRANLEKALIHFNVYKALTNRRDRVLEKSLIAGAEDFLSVRYSPGTVKQSLRFNKAIGIEQNSKVTRIEVYFDSARATLVPDAARRLDGIGRALQDSAFGGCLILVEGHTDEAGEATENCRLSKRRAAAVVDYLRNHWKIEHSSFRAEGRGETAPSIPREGHPRSEWSTIDRFNRRVVIWNAGINTSDRRNSQIIGPPVSSDCAN